MEAHENFMKISWKIRLTSMETSLKMHQLPREYFVEPCKKVSWKVHERL